MARLAEVLGTFLYIPPEHLALSRGGEPLAAEAKAPPGASLVVRAEPHRLPAARGLRCNVREQLEAWCTAPPHWAQRPPLEDLLQLQTRGGIRHPKP
ncbi:unnamed protein product [Symbiodinium natans]|uniref:Uncharacterized protein n=1 Tax=Symbiodinium natans TaxID=878477 RepID=A0A812S3E2_9DINO|nr:unnamed protein product [Symbiodinium natans]